MSIPCALRRAHRSAPSGLSIGIASRVNPESIAAVAGSLAFIAMWLKMSPRARVAVDSSPCICDQSITRTAPVPAPTEWIGRPSNDVPAAPRRSAPFEREQMSWRTGWNDPGVRCSGANSLTRQRSCAAESRAMVPLVRSDGGFMIMVLCKVASGRGNIRISVFPRDDFLASGDALSYIF